MPSGRLAVAWTETGEAGNRVLRFDWTEEGGPEVRPPTRRGFGTTMIERALGYEFGGEVRREFLAAGVRCAVVLPLDGKPNEPPPATNEG